MYAAKAQKKINKIPHKGQETMPQILPTRVKAAGSAFKLHCLLEKMNPTIESGSDKRMATKQFGDILRCPKRELSKVNTLKNAINATKQALAVNAIPRMVKTLLGCSFSEETGC